MIMFIAAGIIIPSHDLFGYKGKEERKRKQQEKKKEERKKERKKERKAPFYIGSNNSSMPLT